MSLSFLTDSGKGKTLRAEVVANVMVEVTAFGIRTEQLIVGGLRHIKIGVHAAIAEAKFQPQPFG